MNSHNINLLQRIYSVYLKIHLFSFISMHVLHLYIIQYFQRCLRTRKQRKLVLRSMMSIFDQIEVIFRFYKTGHLHFALSQTTSLRSSFHPEPLSTNPYNTNPSQNTKRLSFCYKRFILIKF